MGRFDSLKEGKNGHEKKTNNNNKNGANTISTIKKEQPQEQPQEQKEESIWIKRIKHTQNEKKNIIDVNNPIYWNGPYWVGPKFTRIKQNKPCEREMYFKKINEGTASVYIIPDDKLEYSKNGEDWYDSWEDTFTSSQIQALNDYEEQLISNEVFERMNELHEINRYISKRHYNETGELDEFALAEKRAYEYEEYCKQFEEEPVKNEDDYDYEYTEEYLEYD